MEEKTYSVNYSMINSKEVVDTTIERIKNNLVQKQNGKYNFFYEDSKNKKDYSLRFRKSKLLSGAYLGEIQVTSNSDKLSWGLEDLLVKSGFERILRI